MEGVGDLVVHIRQANHVSAFEFECWQVEVAMMWEDGLLFVSQRDAEGGHLDGTSDVTSFVSCAPYQLGPVEA